MSPRLPTARPRSSLILSTAGLCEVIRGRPNAEASQMSSPGPSRVRRQGAAPLALLLAGPNGAGKTTAQSLLLPPEVVFLNADVEAERLISEGRRAEGIDVAAGRAVLTHLKQLVASEDAFLLGDEPGWQRSCPFREVMAERIVRGPPLLCCALQPRTGPRQGGRAGRRRRSRRVGCDCPPPLASGPPVVIRDCTCRWSMHGRSLTTAYLTWRRSR